jgi:hypothetical protein
MKYCANGLYCKAYGEESVTQPKTASSDPLKDEREKKAKKFEQSLLDTGKTDEYKPRTIYNKPDICQSKLQQTLSSKEDETSIKKLPPIEEIIEETKTKQEPQIPQPKPIHRTSKKYPKMAIEEKVWGSVHLKKHVTLEAHELLPRKLGEGLTEYNERYLQWSFEQIRNLQKRLHKDKNDQANP